MNKFQNEFLDVLIADYKQNGTNTDFDIYALELNTYEHDDVEHLIHETFDGDLSYIVQFAINRLAKRYQETGIHILLVEYRELAMDTMLAYLNTLEVEWYE